MSHDVGDIIALFDGRPELPAEVLAADPTLRAYIGQELSAWLGNASFVDLAVPGHLPFEQDRAEVVLERLHAVVP